MFEGTRVLAQVNIKRPKCESQLLALNNHGRDDGTDIVGEYEQIRCRWEGNKILSTV